MSSDAVQVAVRVRPQNVREQAASYQVCTVVSKSDGQIFIGNDKSFGYDFVYDRDSTQIQIYESCVKQLVEGIFNGYNATILAYGQTGSGKTHTMGTAFDAAAVPAEHIGIIPRAVEHIFNGIIQRQQEAREKGDPEPTFHVEIQFVELYNEELIDLLSIERNHNVRIQEDPETNQIVLKNTTTMSANSSESVLEILKNGALNRTTGSTNMNQQSSRSHAIFSVHVKQEKFDTIEAEEKVLTVLTAKLHFVDLAGSERLKRTGATGDRAKEGICINCGLLALGNVICALTGPKKSHVPYRDSKLTRLLQDSLGGNSRTLMIACASPNDVDFAETLNTLNYASRAKAIKNKVMANRDQGGAIVGQLRARIAALESELNEYRQGKRMTNSDGEEMFNDQYHENVMLQSELNKLRVRTAALQETNNTLSQRVTQIKEELERQRLMNAAPKPDSEGNIDPADQAAFETTLAGIIDTYVAESERLNLRLSEMTSECEEYKKKYALLQRRNQEMGHLNTLADSPYSSFSENPIVQTARRELEDQKKLVEILNERNHGPPTEEVETADDGQAMEVDESNEVSDAENDEDVYLAEREQEQAKIVMEVANLQDDINTKERLIHELEQSERRLAQIRRDYERKINELSERISATEAERDKMLLDLAKKSGAKLSDDKMREVKQDYEKRLASLRGDLNKMKSMQSENERARKRQVQQQQELERVRRELQDAKQSKVKLVRQAREEAIRLKKAEMEAARQRANTEKKERLKDNKIRTLEMKDKQREEYLKRRLEQIANMRPDHGTHRTPNFASRRIGVSGGVKKPYSPATAKNKWKALEKKMNACISHHTGINKLDMQYLRLLNEKVEVEKEASQLDSKFVAAKTIEERREIQDDIDTNSHHLKYLDTQIADVRRAITDLECSNKENDSGDDIQVSMRTLIQQCDNIYEARFILEQMLNYAISKAADAEQTSAKIRVLEAKVAESENENAVNERYISDLIHQSARKIKSDTSLLSAAPNETPKRDGFRRYSNTDKIRRRTATSEELLFEMSPREANNQTRIIQPETIPEDDEDITSPTTETNEVIETATLNDGLTDYLIATLRHAKRVVAVDANSGHVVSSGKDRNVINWDVEKQKPIATMNMRRTSAGVHFMERGNPNQILCVNAFTVKVWDSRANQIVSCFHSSGVVDRCEIDDDYCSPNESNVSPVTYSHDGIHMCTRFRNDFRVWDLRNQRSLIKFDAIGSEEDVSATAVYEKSGQHAYFFHAHDNGDIQVNTIKPGFSNSRSHETMALVPSHNNRVVSMFTDDKSLYSAAKNGSIMRFSLIDLTRDFVENDTHPRTLNQMCLLKTRNFDYDTLCTADRGGNIRVWSTVNKNRLQLHKDLNNAHAGAINGLCSMDELLVSCSSDETVKIWRNLSA
ncbi:Kinesin motor domain-containing protein [Aphelenchoides besseyi]|nr:Kinesin motor domain-containing protein [Aphelenchoides besseyi]